ncbi:RagB/SusD family nutrient uptake outer membrane protein [Flavobacterium flavipallidum]|uniref:RagB/SusD family nutrient uptake outer membrane protein n=1 Tax=Flavobacterium flavipallidum TaxID=3139140 RepID=A0ABU9HJZ1_9FLAO
MKNLALFKIISLIVVCLPLSHCESFIEVAPPQSQLTGANTFDELPTATAALSDIYIQMRENGIVSGVSNGGTNLMGNYADELDFYGTNAQLMAFNNHTIVPSSTLISGLWNSTYNQIYAANAVYTGVTNSDLIASEDKNRLLGEALFLRAYLHFYLMNTFGAIPYITSTDYNVNKSISKLTKEELYQNIIADLQQAEVLIPNSYPTAEHVRPNKATVSALLARVSLYAEDWEAAESYATTVIENSLYSWEDDVTAVFLKDSPSIIWALHPGIAGLNTKEARTFVFTSGPPTRPALSLNLMNAFETNDLRKTNWTRTIVKASSSWAHAYKYKKNSNTGTSVEYTILFRLAEQYLIRAEARVHNNDLIGAQEDLNKIRNRAGLLNTTATTPEALLEAILKERRVELFLEQGHRWYDLKRAGEADAVLSPVKPAWENTQILLPLPEAELLLNKNLLPQNTGY